jgi:hypothetical protein
MQVRATNALFLRADPSTDNPPIRLLDPGTILDAVTSHAWREVVYPATGEHGWVAAEYTEEVPPGLPGVDQETSYSLADLLPLFTAAGEQYGVDPRFLAAIAYQESGFKNFRVHRDGTGHGLFGLDDNGLLPDYESWSGQSIGRGPSANIIPVESQIEYAAKVLAVYAAELGMHGAAAAWHRGEGDWNSPRGRAYAQLIDTHMRTLFS